MTDFRICYKDFWSDPRVQQLASEEKDRVISVMLYSIVGIQPNSNASMSGIYPLHPISFRSFFGMTIEIASECLEYLNKNFPSFLQYDFHNNIIFVKEFFENQKKYRPDVAALKDLMAGYNQTFEKVPLFWLDFSLKNPNLIRKMAAKISKADKLSDSEKFDLVTFVDDLLELKNKDLPKTIMRFTSAVKLEKSS
jgi:hypothetical protein